MNLLADIKVRGDRFFIEFRKLDLSKSGNFAVVTDVVVARVSGYIRGSFSYVDKVWISEDAPIVQVLNAVVNSMERLMSKATDFLCYTDVIGADILEEYGYTYKDGWYCKSIS